VRDAFAANFDDGSDQHVPVQRRRRACTSARGYCMEDG